MSFNFPGQNISNEILTGLAGLFILTMCQNQVTLQGYVYDYNLEGIERAKVVIKGTDSVL